MWLQIQTLMSTVRLLDLFDILLVAVVFYNLYFLIKDTRAAALLKGLVVLILATLMSNWFNLHVMHWLLQKTMTVVLVALPVVFQPELRRALEKLGRGRLLRNGPLMNEEETDRLLQEMGTAITSLSKNRIGALIVIEREIGLSDYAESGIQIDGLVSSEFLIHIFLPNTPLHDGAVIIRGNRIMAAGCLLPLTEDRSLGKEFGTRHRAALGLTEQTDAVVVVVSEETGLLSLVQAGRLKRYRDGDELIRELKPVFSQKPSALGELFQWGRGEK